MIIRPVPYQLIRPTPCFDCRSFPCACDRVTPARSEPCACGGVIEVAGGLGVMSSQIAAAVASHNQSTAHEQWAIKSGWR